MAGPGLDVSSVRALGALLSGSTLRITSLKTHAPSLSTNHILQGKAALVQHFQNSSLLHEDKRCRPILFHTEGELAGEPETFPPEP